ncbi:hypothetical protein WG66_009363, partial [Moniliophthora roreri]
VEALKRHISSPYNIISTPSTIFAITSVSLARSTTNAVGLDERSRQTRPEDLPHLYTHPLYSIGNTGRIMDDASSVA